MTARRCTTGQCVLFSLAHWIYGSHGSCIESLLLLMCMFPCACSPSLLGFWELSDSRPPQPLLRPPRERGEGPLPLCPGTRPPALTLSHPNPPMEPPAEEMLLPLHRGSREGSGTLPHFLHQHRPLHPRSQITSRCGWGNVLEVQVWGVISIPSRTLL